MARTVVADGVTHNFPDDATDADIASALASYGSKSVDTTAAPATVRSPSVGRTMASLFPSIQSTGPTSFRRGPSPVDMIPGAAAIGAQVFFPEVPGAMLWGGMSGEALRQAIAQSTGREPTPQTFSQGMGALNRQIGEGAKQVILGRVGEGIISPLARYAPQLYRAALKPSKYVQTRFPGDVTENLMKEGVRLPNPGDVLATRAAQAQASVPGTQAASQLDQLFAAATKRGVQFNAQDPAIASALRDLVEEVGQGRGGPARALKVQQEWLKFIGETRLPGKAGKMGPLRRFTPNEFNALKQTQQSLSEPIYRAVSNGNDVAPDRLLDAQINEAIAKGVRRAIEREVPEAVALNRTMQSGMAMNEAIGDIGMRNPPLPGANLAFTKPMTWMGINNARASRAALALQKPALRGTLANAPRGIEAMLRSLTSNYGMDR